MSPKSKCDGVSSKFLSSIALDWAILKDPDTISHAYFYDQHGEWTPAKGIDWSNDINSHENQKSLSNYDIIN